MSADEFDPMIERLFSKAPAMADEALFTATLEARLEKRSRWRTLALTAAGVLGGCMAVREGVNFNFGEGSGEATTLTQGVRTAAATAQGAAQTGLDGLGLGAFDLMSGSGAQMFWLVAGALFALLAAGVVKLSQDV